MNEAVYIYQHGVTTISIIKEYDMAKRIGNYILAGFWVIGIILAGAEGPISPLINLSGVASTVISSWFIYNKAAFEDSDLPEEDKENIAGRCSERAFDQHDFCLRE